jgi:hypothetical protein
VPQWRFVGGRFYMYIDPKDWMDRGFYLDPMSSMRFASLQPQFGQETSASTWEHRKVSSRFTWRKPLGREGV